MGFSPRGCSVNQLRPWLGVSLVQELDAPQIAVANIKVIKHLDIGERVVIIEVRGDRLVVSPFPVARWCGGCVDGGARVGVGERALGRGCVVLVTLFAPVEPRRLDFSSKAARLRPARANAPAAFSAAVRASSNTLSLPCASCCGDFCLGP